VCFDLTSTTVPSSQRGFSTMRHIHCQTIVKWANGAQIERLHSDGQWRMEINPTWSTDQKYRVSATSQDLRTIIFCVPFLHIDSSNGILSVTRLAETLGTLGVNVVFMCVLSEYPKEELIFTNTLQNCSNPIHFFLQHFTSLYTISHNNFTKTSQHI
jgi:hypothetical protein